jgi:uncharacterized membrane-anchored protein
MPRSWREWLVLACGALVLVAVNAGIFGRERHLAEGRVVLLELAPVDPRSLMQGDYMALRFKAETDAFARGRAKDGEDGRLVVRLDARGVGTYARRDDGAPLAGAEVALKYRVRAGNVKFATNAYFFREGTGGTYEAARYGEFRVAKSGELLLARLRDKDLAVLGPR